MNEKRSDNTRPAEIVAEGDVGGDSCPGARARARARVREWFALPPTAWSRIVVLLAALVIVKLVLLIVMRKHLQEIHWRVSGQPTTWLSYVAFYTLIGVGVCTLLELGRRCRAFGVRAVRRVNLIILGLALLLICLTFHEGDKNYLYPILTKVLPWSSLVPYLSMDLFFRPPYLAGWLLGYAASYYIMTRLGREEWALGLTSVFAAGYWILCLQEFMGRRDDLWTAAVFGLLAVIVQKRRDQPFHPAWWLVPAGWTLLTWGVFGLEERTLANLSQYFIILLGLATTSFMAASWLAARQGLWRPWGTVLAFYFLTFLLLSDSNYPMGGDYNNILRFAAKFPHYFLGELGVAGLIAVLAVLYVRFRPRGGFWWVDVLAVGLILLALVDLRLTQIMGVRLGWDVIQFGNSPVMMWRMAKPYLPGLVAAVVVASLAYGAAVYGVSRALRRGAAEGHLARSRRGGGFVIGCFALIALLGTLIAVPDNVQGQSIIRLVKSSPLWMRTTGRIMKPEEFQRTARELGMPGLGTPRSAPSAPKPANLNVLLILQESSYNKHSSLFGAPDETQPLLTQYRDRMEVFPNFFSSFASSIHARFATFTGLYPICDFNAFTLNRVGVKSIFEVMHENAYACMMFYSSYADYTGFRDFLKNRGLDALYDADTMPGERKTERISWGLREEETLGAIQMQIRKQARLTQPFFLTYIPAAPHYPYDKVPEQFHKHTAGRYGDYTPFYLNELLYMDWIVASILDELKATDLLDRTLVVITSDHGEMLGGEDKLVGHGWQLSPELANVPFILLDPRRPGYRINYAVGSQVDLLPTILESLEIPLPPGELYQGRSLLSPPAKGETGRCIYLNTYQDYAVIRDDLFWKGDRQREPSPDASWSVATYRISNRGPETLFTAVTNVSDPAISIRQFDRFQESLLRNYSIYRDSLSGQVVKDSPVPP